VIACGLGQVAVAASTCSVFQLLPMYLVVAFLLLGSLGFAITWLFLRWLCMSRPWRRLNRAAAQLHHASRSRVVRFGGLGLAVTFAVTSFLVWMNMTVLEGPDLFNPALVVGALGMFMVGFADDLKPLGAKRKLLGQILVALVAVRMGLVIEGFQNPFTGTAYGLGLLSTGLTVFWLVSLTNLMNLIDGMDGFAGGVALMLMALMIYMGLGDQGFTFYVAIAMAGALHAFLMYNYPPAKIYLGDGGAYFLGFLIAGMSVANSNKGSVLAALLAPVMALGLPIIDTLVTVARRAWVGLPPFRADRRHLHHKLIARGFTRRKAVLTLYALSVPCLLLAFGTFLVQGRVAPLLFGLLFMSLAGGIWGLRHTTSNVFNLPAGAMGLARLRSESRYGLCLGQWLLLEAERCGSVAELFRNFGFLADKFGFSHVRVTMGSDTELWQSNHLSFDAEGLHRAQHQVGGPCPMVLEFTADPTRLTGEAFDHLAELAAEAWVKATRRWQLLSGEPLRFDARTDLTLRPPSGMAPLLARLRKKAAR
jgi:UDP-GlcNAc:undecaprenyl-phosphate/decaprenyl-phosphate GlcNAc-1-phosphate transferase